MLSRVIGLGIIILLVLSACDTTTANVTSTATLQGAIVPTRLATHTPLPTNTATNTPTITPSPTNTATPTATATSTNTPTITPSPTLTLTPTPQAQVEEIGNRYLFRQENTVGAGQSVVEYLFTAKENDAVAIEVNSDVEIWVQVFAPDGSIITENSGLQVNFEDVGIVTDGQHTIRLARVTADGEFNIRYTHYSFDNNDPDTGIELEPLDYGFDIEDDIDDETYFRPYVFRGQAGDTVTIAMDATSGDLDPYLLLINRQTQEILAESDDLDNSTNARIEGITLPSDGDYIILATRFQGADGSTHGDFVLQLR